MKKNNQMSVKILFLALIFSLGLNVFQFSKSIYSNNDTPSAVVERVIDGDSFITADGIRMRLSNIEAPELQYCGGNEAKQRLQYLIEGKNVKVIYNSEDIYNRSIVLVYQGNKFVNKILLSEGLARYDGSKSPARDELRDAYQKAVKQELGIFSSKCRSLVADNPDCSIKGNIERNTGIKRYIFPGCSEYNRTIVEKDLGESWFCSESQAKKEGYIKASNCP